MLTSRCAGTLSSMLLKVLVKVPAHQLAVSAWRERKHFAIQCIDQHHAAYAPKSTQVCIKTALPHAMAFRAH